MRVFSRKSLGFTNPDPDLKPGDPGHMVCVSAGEFADVPEWVRKDDMFQWARAGGDIEVLETEPRVSVPDQVSKAAAPDEKVTGKSKKEK
jgi:hypothetical protein